MKKIVTHIAEFYAETTDDSFGGDHFWEMIEANTYEPDTMKFLELFVNTNSNFVDLGAANGAISLIAASLGAKVLSIEAAPSNVKLIQRNIDLNPNLKNSIEVRNVAVSNVSGELAFSEGSNSEIFSSIVFSKPNILPEVIKVEPLDSIVSDFAMKERNLIIKMDIEGAEWLILKSRKILEELSNHKAVMLLAIHPGFHRQINSRFKAFNLLKKIFWQIQNIVEVYKVFSLLLEYSEIRRTNLDKILSPKKIVMLMFGGYFEFVLEFDKRANF